MKPHSAAVILMIMLTAAAPLPDKVVPGERPVIDAEKYVTETLQKLGSTDQAVYEAAMGQAMSMPARYFEKLVECSKRPGVDKTAKSRLDALVVRRTPLLQADAVYRKRTSIVFDAVGNQFQKAYQSSKHGDPKWDADVSAGIGYYTLSTQTGDAASEHNAQLRSSFYLERAINLGCDDPGVLALSVFAKDKLNSINIDQARDIFTAADASDKKLPTTPYVKALIDGRMARGFAGDPEHASEIEPRLSDMVAQLKKMAADKDIPDGLVRDMAHNIDDTAAKTKQDRFAWFQRYWPDLEAAYPQSAYIQCFKGDFYIDYAWEGRGSASSAETTPEQFQLLHDRLLIAKQALEKAWELDPDYDRTPVLMMKVVLGLEGDKDELNKWFHRAAALKPDSVDVYARKFTYLEPKWHGSPDELIAFGKECVATGYFQTSIPLELVAAHKVVAATLGDRGYLARPAVWQDISGVYEQTLRWRPTETGIRVDYAEIATLAQKWIKADEQFKIIGDLAPSTPADTLSKYNALRSLAAREARKVQVD